MDWMTVKWLYVIIYFSSLFVILSHNILCNRWQWHVRHVHVYVYVKDFTLFIDLIYLFTFFFLYSHFLFFEYGFLLSSLLFTYFNYEFVDLFGKKGIPLIHFTSILVWCELMSYVSTHTYFLTPQYNLVMGALLSLEW